MLLHGAINQCGKSKATGSFFGCRQLARQSCALYRSLLLYTVIVTLYPMCAACLSSQDGTAGAEHR